MDEKITLLTREQVDDEKYINLRVFKKGGAIAKPTDFYIIQGGYVDEGKGNYWTKTPYFDDSDFLIFLFASQNVFSVYSNGTVDWNVVTGSYGVRPVIPLSKIYQSEKSLNISKINGIEEIEYGEYPQSIVNERLENELELLYQQDRLFKTEKKYILMDKGGKHEYQEYKYYGDKYIRLYSNISGYNREHKNCNFSNGRKVEEEKTYWVKVEPIKWLVNRSIFEKNNIAISKKILASMPFSYSNNNNYEESDIKEFLEKYFVKNIVSSKLILTREEERIMKQKKLLDDRFEKSQVVHDKLVEKERKAAEEAKRLKEERKREIEGLENGLIQDLDNLGQKYDKLVKLDPDRKIKRPQVYIEKDVLCRYDMEEKCYKIKDKFLPYVSYIQFPYDMDNVDVRGLDLRYNSFNVYDVYKKSFEGCNLNGNESILNEVTDYKGCNFDNAKIYSDNVLFLSDVFINTKTIKSINKKYIKEALDGAILDKDAVEFLNNNREEYGIDTSINVKVRNGENIEDTVLFKEYGDYEGNSKYDEVIEEFKRKGFSIEDLKNMVNIMEKREKNSKHR